MTLYARIASLIAVLVVGFGTVAAFWVGWYMDDALRREISSRGEAIARAMAQASIRNVIDGDVIRQTEVLRSGVRQNQDIAYIYVTDLGGELFAHTFEGGFPAALLRLESPADADHRAVSRHIDTTMGEIHQVSYPLIAATPGRVYIGLDRGAANAKISQIRLWIVVITLGVAVIGVLIGFFLSRRITDPLRRLVRLIEAYGRDEESPDENPLPVGAASEVKALQEAFTVMMSERREGETALRASEASLANAQRIARIGNWDWNIETGALQWSDEIYRIVGQTPQGFPATYEAFLNTVHPDDRDAVETAVAAAVSDRQPYNIDHRICLSDGEIRTVNEQGVVEYTDEGVAVRMTGTVKDITDRKQAEDGLRESEARYRSLTEVVPEAVLVTDHGKILYCNAAAVRLFGAVNESQLKGMDQARLLHPDDRKFLQPRIDEAPTARPLSTMLELRRVRLDGTEFVSESRSAPFVWQGQDVRLVIIRDITDRKRAEQQLRRLNEDLEIRVAERTAELATAHDELVKSERLATLGQLTATVSHELRNPLGAMRTSIYMLRNHMPSTDERLIRAAERIDRNISRCDSIIDELLDFTRIRDLDLSVTALDDWLGGVLDEQSVPQGMEVRYNRGGADIVAKIDPDRLRRAVINVFENGCQAMQGVAGEMVLTVTTRTTGGRIELSFRDNGPGIAPEVRDKIFEPLFSTKGFGVGLGLCVVRQIIEKHGGGIEISSETGIGTDMVLWLPLHRFMEAAE